MPHEDVVTMAGPETTVPAALDPEFEALLRQCLDGSIAPGTPLRADTDLALLGIDSLTVVRLLVTIEDAYEVTVPEEMIAFEIFSSPGVLWNVVSGLREEQRAR